MMNANYVVKLASVSKVESQIATCLEDADLTGAFSSGSIELVLGKVDGTIKEGIALVDNPLSILITIEKVEGERVWNGDYDAREAKKGQQEIEIELQRAMLSKVLG